MYFMISTKPTMFSMLIMSYYKILYIKKMNLFYLLQNKSDDSFIQMMVHRIKKLLQFVSS